jgi:septal ring factor EnvC (AmiA/AmiB activator)
LSHAISILVCVFSVFCVGDLAAQTSERARAEALARRAAARIRALHAEAERLAGQERTILNELRQLELDRQLKAEEVRRLDSELLAVDAELKAAAADEAALQKRVVTSAPAVGARLAAVYRMGRAGYWRLLLNVDDVQSVGRAYRTVAAMGRIDRERIQEHQRALAALRATRTSIEQRSASLRRLQGEATRARAALDRAIAGRNARVDAIDRERDLTARLTGELQDAQRRLQLAVSDMASDGGAPVALPIAPFRGDLPWPARGRVVAAFGKQRASRFGTSIIRNGVTIAAAEGRAVGAIHEGTVAFAGPFTGYGQLVIIDHGGESYSLYGHLEDVTVEKGSRVERQRQLGTVGRAPTGEAALYFELRIDGRPVDPLQWLKR